MAYSYTEMKTFSGLYLQANSLSVPDGAMETAQNIIIKSDNIISKRRGSYRYFNPSVTNMNQLFFYKNRLLAAYANKLSYFTDTGSSPNETGTETDLTGVTVTIDPPRVARSVEANNNLYITSDRGILKLEDYNSNVFDGGAPQGLDISLNILPSSVGPIDPNKSVGYRIIFGRRDANSNLILGAPSNIGTIYVPAGGTGVSYTSSGAGPYTVTVTSTSHGLITGQDIIVNNATDTDANGVRTITVTGTNTFTFSTAADPTSGTLDYTFTRQILLEGSIPSDITSGLGWFAQIYRSSQATGNVTPSLDFKLIAEYTLTSTDITNRLFFFTDDIDDILLGAELYTNPNSREGELQANYRPPSAQDVTFYKNSVLYANVITHALLDFDVIDAGSLVADDYIEMKIDTTVKRYIARTGVSNQTVVSQGITNAAGDLQIDYASHGFSNGDSIYISNITGGSLTAGTYYVVASAANSFEISLTFGGASIAHSAVTSLYFQGLIHPITVAGVNWSRSSSVVTVTSPAHGLTTGMTIQVSASAGGAPNVALANYQITVTGVNTFTFSETAANSSGTLDYRINSYMFYLNNTSISIAVQLRDTASGIVKAVNRDPASLVYANYISTTIPGQMRFQAKGFTGTMYVRANTTTAGGAFLPTLPSSFSSGQQVFSDADDQPNVIYVSKISEPEAVPIVNFYQVGSRTKAILRIMSLRDSVIIVKEDGLFRLTGDNPQNYAITVLDNTVLCVAPSSAKLLNNEVILLSNQGVCRVSESSVEIVSRRIDDVIQPILGASTLSAQTTAVAYESERIYLLSTIQPNSTTMDVTYCYNILNQSWSTWNILLKQGVIGPSDSLYYIDENTDLFKERKKQTRIDYCGQNTSLTMTSVASNKLSAVVNSPTTTISVGDTFVKDSVFSRVFSVSNVGTVYTVTFARQTNMNTSDSVILYKAIESQIKMSPIHAGEVGRMKQFAQMQLHFRDENFSRANISFVGYTFGGSEPVDWIASAISGQSGWGLQPWGFFPWGLTDAINTTIGTKPASVCRIYVPLFQQRTTFIQPVIIHNEAGESINMQAMAFAVRAYAERVSR